jgi:hypothetical protein
MICTFHKREVSRRNVRVINFVRHKCVWDYNVAVGHVDRKDRKLQPICWEEVVANGIKALEKTAEWYLSK